MDNYLYLLFYCSSCKVFRSEKAALQARAGLGLKLSPALSASEMTRVTLSWQWSNSDCNMSRGTPPLMVITCLNVASRAFEII